MTTDTISFLPQESGFDPLSGAIPIAMNVVVDDKGTVRRRPGIQQSEFVAYDSGVDAPVVGLYCTVDGVVYVVIDTRPDRLLFRVGPGGFLPIAHPPMVSQLRPTFAETQALLCIADGFDVYKIVLATDLCTELGGDPPKGTHIIAQSDRLLINQLSGNKGQINYSAIAIGDDYTGHETWVGSAPGAGTAGFFTAEARPDPVVCLAENTNEVVALGVTTLQTFDPDDSFVFAPIQTREYGCSAPYSLVKVNQQYAWLDHERRFIMGDGRATQEISDPAIQNTLDEITRIDDCFGYRVKSGPVELLVWTFPTDGRTFAYTVGGGWSEWAAWDSVPGNWSVFPVTSSQIRPLGGQCLVGTLDGKAGELKFGLQDDLGVPIRAFVETGYYDRGTDAYKLCKRLLLALRRADPSSVDNMLLVSYRDDDGAWVGPFQVEISGQGYSTPVVELRSLGCYRRRQWRFEFSGTSNLVLVSAREEYDVLEV